MRLALDREAYAVNLAQIEHALPQHGAKATLQYSVKPRQNDNSASGLIARISRLNSP